MSGIVEAISGIFGTVYVNRKIFPKAGKVFLRKRYRAWAGPVQAPDLVKSEAIFAAIPGSRTKWIM